MSTVALLFSAASEPYSSTCSISFWPASRSALSGEGGLARPLDELAELLEVVDLECDEPSPDSREAGLVDQQSRAHDERAARGTPLDVLGPQLEPRWRCGRHEAARPAELAEERPELVLAHAQVASADRAAEEVERDHAAGVSVRDLDRKRVRAHALTSAHGADLSRPSPTVVASSWLLRREASAGVQPPAEAVATPPRTATRERKLVDDLLSPGTLVPCTLTLRELERLVVRAVTAAADTGDTEAAVAALVELWEIRDAITYAPPREPRGRSARAPPRATHAATRGRGHAAPG